MYTTAMSSRRAALRSSLLVAAVLTIAFDQSPAHSEQPPAAVTPSVHIDVLPREERYRAQVVDTTQESLRLLDEWLDLQPQSNISLTTNPVVAVDADATRLHVDLPWRIAQSAMEVESQVAYRVAQAVLPQSDADSSVSQGIAWYLQSRIVEHLFNLSFAAPGHSTESLRLFGGHIPHGFPSLRLTRWRGGLGGNQGVRRPPGELDAAATRIATAFAALERYLGWPVLQGGLRELAKDRTTPLTAERVTQTISAAAGQDLTWFFRIAFDPAQRVEYALTHFSSEPGDSCAAGPCHRTRVTVARLGSAAFPGTSRERQGEYEAGDGVQVQVTFADGAQVIATWDGREPQRVFEFESAAPATVARLDPAGTLLLDSNLLDHAMRRQPVNNVPMAKWMARWSLWLQHALLGYVMLV